MKKFLVIGPAFLEISISLKDKKNFKKNNLSISAGGKGYNVAHNLSLFGVKSVLASMYGGDDIGGFLENYINKQKIETLPTNIVRHNSGVFVGVNNSIGETIFDKSDTRIFAHQKFPKLDWKSVGVVIVMSSTNNEVLEGLKKIKNKHKDIVFCLEISGSKSVENIVPFLDIFDFLICNQKEANAIGKSISADRSVKSIIKALNEKGIDLVIVTLDKKGAVCGLKREGKTCFKQFSICLGKGKLISTIGAGDSVTAAFCASYYGFIFPIDLSMEIAMELASLTVRTELPVIDKLPRKILNKIKL